MVKRFVKAVAKGSLVATVYVGLITCTSLVAYVSSGLYLGFCDTTMGNRYHGHH